MFEINDVVIIKKIGNKSSYEPILNKKGVVVNVVNSCDPLTMMARHKYYVDVNGHKNEYQPQGYYVFEDETYLERAYQDVRICVPDHLDAIAYAMQRREFYIEKENKTMEILNLYNDIKRDEVRQKRTKELEKLKNSHPVIKAINEFRNSMKDVKGLMFSYNYAFEKDAEFDAKIEKLNEKYDKKLAEIDAEFIEIRAMLSECETYEQKQNILKAYGVIDEHGKLRK